MVILHNLIKLLKAMKVGEMLKKLWPTKLVKGRHFLYDDIKDHWLT